ncbi:MAG: hydrogenase maturation protein [Rhodospirillales bacterium]|jgi:putative two-component system protein, hydrogenase maturation factor HypX/HoxX|nr:hydrogenase maturation protein [Rhodospirillales bacterium]
MRILLLVHAFNSLSQRIFSELEQARHDVSVEFDVNDAVTKEAVALFNPDVIVAPFLKRAVAEDVWRNVPCLIVHPGIPGDRGPSALDWAILNNEDQWGVTVLQAEAGMDTGPIWAWMEAPLRPASKSSLYRNEITQAAVAAVKQALERIETEQYIPLRAEQLGLEVLGQERLSAKQMDRKIGWLIDDTKIVLRKLRSADGVPGVRDSVLGRSVFLHDGREAPGLSGYPGDIIAKSGPAICRATVDGAVWIGHVWDKDSDHPFKLPATMVFKDELSDIEEILLDSESGYSEIRYEEKGQVGYLHFDFYNGAMGVAQCERLLAAYKQACQCDTKVIVLMGGRDFWSNGMHLNLIEADDSPADYSWQNINAIDDLAEEIIRTESHVTVAALQGNVGAGGVFLARACDQVWLREGIMLSPHYKDMGNLYGSEFWTYLLPRYAGEENARRIIDARLPMGTQEAVELGLADACFGKAITDFIAEVSQHTEDLDADCLIASKQERRLADEKLKPLSEYRREELEKMRLNFYGFDPSYHVARYNFVYKIPKSRTPLTIARHRDKRETNERRVAS